MTSLKAYCKVRSLTPVASQMSVTYSGSELCISTYSSALCTTRLVELHGGSVEAKSEGPGKGSEFIVRLPLRDRTITSNTPKNQAADAKIDLRILVVDDNRDGAESLSRMLKLEGHEIRTAYDGLAAVEAACKFQPDVILLDIGLPKISGYEVCKLIRQEPWGKKMFIIAQTGWGQEEDRQKAQAAGFNHHLVKPLDTVELLTLLSGITPRNK